MFFHCNGCGTLTMQPLGHTNEGNKERKFALNSALVVDSKCLHCGGKNIVRFFFNESVDTTLICILS